MQKRHRRILFWLAVTIFGAASYIIILYAQGYKYDFAANHFVRTGALAVNSNVTAKLYVDDRLVGQTSFISDRVGDDNLLPGSYDIRLVRDGYSSWHKTAKVQEGLLTDFPKVMLLPTDEDSVPALKEEILASLKDAHTLKDPTPTPRPSTSPSSPRQTPPILPTPLTVISGQFALRGRVLYRMNQTPELRIAEDVLGFQVTTDGSRVLWFTRNEVWVLWLNNTDYQPFRTEGERELVTRFAVPITKASWFRDVDHIAVDLGGVYRVLEIDARGGINIIKI